MQRVSIDAIQKFVARYAVLGSFRGTAGGTTAAARGYLGSMELAPFATGKRDIFLQALDSGTEALREAVRARAQNSSSEWGYARKGLNIFLRDCLYNFYLRDAYGLGVAENLPEVPLDSIVAKRLERQEDAGAALPGWTTIKALDPATSARYQSAARSYGDARNQARVHLDADWWGGRTW